MPEPKIKHVLIPESAILQKVRDFALILDQEYRGRGLTVIMTLKGSLCFVADLIRELHIPCLVETVRCQSYGAAGMQRGVLTVLGIESLSLQGRDVLIVDDIFDSGATLYALYQELLKKKPRSLKTVALIKKNIPREISYIPDYALFEIENQFVVGYGTDYKELYRGLKSIYVME